MKVVTTDETFLGRTRQRGHDDLRPGRCLGRSRPDGARSGIPRDVRARLSPYLGGIRIFPIKVITERGGDLAALLCWCASTELY